MKIPDKKEDFNNGVLLMATVLTVATLIMSESNNGQDNLLGLITIIMVIIEVCLFLLWAILHIDND